MEQAFRRCEETLTRQLQRLVPRFRRTGSLTQILRQRGLAARFVSGYLIQLVADVKSLDGPSGASADFTDLHAWTEVYIPNAEAGFGLDQNLRAAGRRRGHIPLACTADPVSASPILGFTDECKSEFSFSMKVTRIHEDPRVTKPYSDEQWKQIVELLGHHVDAELESKRRPPDDAGLASRRLSRSGITPMIRNGTRPRWSPRKRVLRRRAAQSVCDDKFAAGALLPELRARQNGIRAENRCRLLGAGLLLAQGWRTRSGAIRN